MLRPPPSAVFLYAVVSSRSERVVEFFSSRADADEFIAKVRDEEPDHAARLRVATFELMVSPN
jgi:hypothetical protein